MSMFRRPGDSSSSSDASEEQTENEETGGSMQDSFLSRINSLDSATPGQPIQTHQPSLVDVRQNSTQNVRDLLLHSLLEERTIREVAEQIGKDASDPETQRLGRRAYQQIAHQISNNVDDTYASDEMQAHRATANEGINRLTRSNLNKLSTMPDAASQALVARPPNALIEPMPQQLPPGFDIVLGISAPVEPQLRGYPHLQTDRYFREFSELEVIGKGGYGKVYKAKHKLDGAFYAVKRIPVSSAKVAKIQEHGSQELESMLEEVRSLARFEHNNVVRYHNAWLEFTTTPPETQVVSNVTVLRDDRLLEDPAAFPSSSPDFSNLQNKLDSLSFDDPFARTTNSNGAGIIFESSNPGQGREESKSETDSMSLKEKLRRVKRRNRRGSQASQATIATVSSTKSRMSAFEDIDEDEEDEDIETIPRSHMPYSQEPISDMSDSMVTTSDLPRHLIQSRNLGPVLMLNVQMSLCETNLAAFLSSDRSSSNLEKTEQHCFHPCVSLELLHNIVSGVRYLHSRGVVHRDLKPANVFLSLSTDQDPPYGSVDLSTCKPCPKRGCIHMTPRIGDFGLVAALDDKCMGVDSSTKPVGTEFYRPPTSGGINEKLDVFALGVVAFEMLQKFGTRMERFAALTELRRGVFPNGFAESLGNIGYRVQQLISDMVQMDEQKRLSCDEVKSELGELVRFLRV
ncbi:kinase-like protein [Clathrospora elynae]|uniref:Kinase-like protein n=1 Tax=Clathrospora elynae TaxID=706981 RepID=A0A6A5SW66_9PLEO|nr:kinase-like protein [Clathrospora elynae]